MIPRRLVSALGAVLAAAGCAAITPPPDTARIPLWAGPYWQGDDIAILHADWAWADPSRTHGLPIEGARAVAEVDYLAGELSSNPRFVGLSPFAKAEMLQARTDVRRALGIAPDAPSQAVVDALLAALAALDAGNRPQALASLSSPLFTRGAEQTFALLAALPYVQSANLGTAMAARSATMPGEALVRGS